MKDKEIVITMEPGVIEASHSEGDQHVFLGRLEINRQVHSDYMRSEQIDGFLGSVVLPMLNGFARELEAEAIEKEEAAAEAAAE